MPPRTYRGVRTRTSTVCGQRCLAARIAQMDIHVGSLEIVAETPPRNGWVVAAAPSVAPYWTLFDDAGQPTALLLLLFRDDAEASDAIEERLDQYFPALKSYVV